MSDGARAAYFLAGLVAVFVLAYVVGALAGPWLLEEPAPHDEQHQALRPPGPDREDPR